MNGKRYPIPKGSFPTLDLSEKYHGKEVILDIDLVDGNIAIYNGAEMKLESKALISYCSGWSAMKIEEISPTKKRYYCNDYENDDDFDDLIFEMEILD